MQRQLKQLPKSDPVRIVFVQCLKDMRKDAHRTSDTIRPHLAAYAKILDGSEQTSLAMDVTKTLKEY